MERWRSSVLQSAILIRTPEPGATTPTWLRAATALRQRSGVHARPRRRLRCSSCAAAAPTPVRSGAWPGQRAERPRSPLRLRTREARGADANGDIVWQAKTGGVSIMVQTGGALAASVNGKAILLTIPAATPANDGDLLERRRSGRCACSCARGHQHGGHGREQRRHHAGHQPVR